MSGQPNNQPNEPIFGGLPRRVYRNLMARISNGDTVCELKYADAYRPLTALLDEFGVVLPGRANEYGGAFRRARSQIDSNEPGSRKHAVYRRLVDHLKKNRVVRKAIVFEKPRGAVCIDRLCESRFGFTVSELENHLEKLFTPGMTWDRLLAGDIQIDHEIPVRVFDLSTEKGIKAAYALSNLQPLWRGDNARKGKTSDLVWIELFGEGAIRE